MSHERRDRAVHEGLITAIAVGGTLILLGLVALSPGFLDAGRAFIRDFTSQVYMVGSADFHLPYPAHPAAHNAFYQGVMMFIVGIAVLQIIILPLRLAFHSAFRRIAETVGNLIFWVGLAIAGYVFLLAGTREGWFQFWSSLIILAGASLIAQGMVYFSKRQTHRSEPCC